MDEKEKKDKRKVMFAIAGYLMFYCAFGVALTLFFHHVLGMYIKNVWLEGLQIGLISWLFVVVLPILMRKPRRR